MSTPIIYNLYKMSLFIDFFKSPDSSVYFYIKSENLKLLETDLSFLLTKFSSQEKIRVLVRPDFSLKKQDLKSFFTDFFNKNNLDLKIQDYQTNFFSLKKSQAQTILDKLSLSEKTGELEIIKVETELDLAIYQNFQLNSFGVRFNPVSKKIEVDKTKQDKILTSFLTVSQQPNLELFLVKNSENQFLGGFSLVCLDKEIQLHSVAGLAKNIKLQQKSKLSGLVRASLEIFLNSNKYQKQDEITFTSSKTKIAEKYKDLGFQTDPKRFGFLISH